MSNFVRRPKQETPFAERFGNFIDGAIGVFSPKAAFHRKQARAALKVFSSYPGASKDRLRSNWLPGNGSADADLLPDLAVLRERSRDLARGDGYAAGIQKTMVTNVIGQGIKLQSNIKAKALGITDDEADILKNDAESVFQRWSENSDITRQTDFDGLQRLIFQQIIDNGDVIVLPVRIKRPGVKYSLALQVIEADRLTTPLDKISNQFLREGVEIGEYGEPKGYYIKKTHPGDGTLSNFQSNDFEYYPAYDKFGRKNVLHIFERTRAGQNRGVPVLAPVLNLFKDLSSYIDAELMKNRIAACFALFVKKNDPMGAAAGRANSTNAQGQKLESVEPGRIDYLSPGEEIQVAAPNGPQGAFDPFVYRLLSMIAASLNLPYEVVAKDFSKSNYSSARSALLDAVKFFKCWQKFIQKQLCQHVYEWVLEDAFLSGEFSVPNFYSMFWEYRQARWQSPGWQWVDPKGEVDAALSAIDGKLQTHSSVIGALGEDWEETFEQAAIEKKKAEKLGLVLNPPKPSGPGAPPKNDQGQDPKTPSDQTPQEAQANAA